MAVRQIMSEVGKRSGGGFTGKGNGPATRSGGGGSYITKVTPKGPAMRGKPEFTAGPPRKISGGGGAPKVLGGGGFSRLR